MARGYILIRIIYATLMPLCLWALIGSINNPHNTDFARPFFVVLTVVFALLTLFGVVTEFGYHWPVSSGLPAAKVLDPEPIEPGQRAVVEQQAQGKSHLNTEIETHDAAAGAVRRSSVHDQEF